MKTGKELLRERYFSPIKDRLELFIGVELEFPIVNTSGQATDLRVVRGLMDFLLGTNDFQILEYDNQGYPIKLESKDTKDLILFEVSYASLELAFSKVQTIQEVEQRFQVYLDQIQEFLKSHDHELQGIGINPNWHLNGPLTVQSPRYEMLTAYLSLGNQEDKCHDYPYYGSFICGNQVQLDVSRENVLDVINTFNRLEPLKAYLFANSRFPDFDTGIARDIFWEESMHGLLEENIGVNPKDFETEVDFLDYLSRSAMFTVTRQEQIYYFPPRPVQAYFEAVSVEAFDLEGNPAVIKPEETDIAYHRSYQYQDLTKRGTVEFRSICTQPFERTFAPTAFHLGAMVKLNSLKDLLRNHRFYYGKNLKELRRRYAQKKLSAEEKASIHHLLADVLPLIIEGLEQRGQGEEKYLAFLKNNY